MKCPNLLQPQQIVKLVEVEPIYKVLQWLVKKVFQHREENEERIRSCSEFGVKKVISKSESSEKSASVERALKYLQWSEYLPARKYKRKDTISIPNDPWTHSKLVMLEYGREFIDLDVQSEEQQTKIAKKAKDSISQTSLARQKLQSHFKMQSDSTSPIENSKNLQEELEIDKGKISLSVVGDIMEINEIQSAREKHVRNEQELKRMKAEQGNSDEFLHKRKMGALHKQLEVLKKDAFDLKSERDIIEQKYNESKTENDKYSEFNQKINDKLNDMKKVVADENLSEDERNILRKLQQLVKLNESLKQQEIQFRQSCKDQLEKLNQKIEELEKQKQSKEFSALNEISEQLVNEEEKLKKVKLVLAKKNRDLLVIQRKIDEIPVRSEISQYESRFEELYSETIAKLEETRKYYDQFNTLSDTHAYLQKELQLFKQIHEYFEKSLKTKNKEYKPWMIKTVANLVAGVQKSFEGVEQQLKIEQLRRDESQKKFNILVSQQREYFRTIKDFEKEAGKSKELRKTLQNLNSMLQEKDVKEQ